MKKLSVRFHKGFVSTYFLSILLYCSVLLTMMASNDTRRLETAMNMKENDAYFLQEAAVVSDIRCRLDNDRLEEGTFVTVGYTYDVNLRDDRIYAEIRSDHPETLNIVWDSKERILLDLTCTRPGRKT